MSIGIYIASFYDLKIRETADQGSEYYSINDLKMFDNYSDIIADLKANLSLDFKKIDESEKIFLFPDETEESFSVKRERDSRGVIWQYTDRPFIYYIDIYSWDNLYKELSELLQPINFPFELWLIWEDSYEADDLKKVKLDSLDPLTLEKSFGINEYLDPIVGFYE